MRRVLIAELKQETATFNPWPTRYADFRIHRGADLIQARRGTKTEVCGALDVFEAEGDIQVVPAMSATSVSGGAIPAADLDGLISGIVASIRSSGNVDAAYLCLHGAMAGEDEIDPEGRLLQEVREIIGDVPLVASLDLHAILTERMLACANVLVPFHTYPHVDQYETGQRSACVLLKLLDGSVTPATARVELPMIVRGDELITRTGRFGEAIRMCRDVAAAETGLAAGVIIGNAFTDVPDLKSNVIVTTNGDPESARRHAERIATFMWDHRELFQAELTPLDESIRIAEGTDGLTVFSDAADATASGASGDSNAILEGLLETGFEGTALVPIVDASAVRAAAAAGVGATIDVTLGGTRDPGRFTPLPVTAEVAALPEGPFRYENGTEDDAGGVAVLRIGSITVMATARSVYVVGRAVFLSHGLDPEDFDVVVVKSPNGFRTWYEPIAARIVPVDVPGSTSANLHSLPFQHCRRPIWPLDENAELNLGTGGLRS